MAAKAAKAPTGAQVERAREFAREPFLLEGEKLKDLVAGSARRMALDAALAEIDEGRETPSAEWRREYSLMLGLERVLADEVPRLADGAELNPHQVDALSGTLAALITELEGEQGPAATNGAGPDDTPDEVEPEPEPEPELEPEPEPEEDEPDAGLEDEEDEEDEEDDDEPVAEEDDDLAPDEEPMDWEAEPEDTELAGADVLEDPGASRRFWFEHATGAGKTVAAVGFIEASRTGGILILTHRRNLVDQFIGEISDRGYAERLSPPILGDADHPYGPVTVETYQWFVRNAGKVSDAYSIVICDEAHTALGEKTSACIRAWTGPVFIGMTATGALIARHVADLFPTQTSRFDLGQAARRGVISPLRCIRIPPGPGVRTIANVPLRKGEVDQEFDQEELAKLLDQGPFNAAIADLYKSRFRNVPGLVYTAGVKHATNVAKAFQDAGINARAVSGETPKRELAEILAGFERGEVDVLCNAMLLAEGWNSPRATICMHLAPTASRRIYQQRVGRVTRRTPGKEAGLVVDFVHPATTHDENVITLHSLLDRDVYRGGAIVVGPVRRGRGRRVRVEKRVVPVSG
ncbi:MAG: DEAD/DEAH box helicase family protein, partial [Solirubrobacterales bacterium]|nr:DEAD/DEAH box helicase family protein [Solirubrobacterales bacterium]